MNLPNARSVALTQEGSVVLAGILVVAIYLKHPHFDEIESF